MVEILTAQSLVGRAKERVRVDEVLQTVRRGERHLMILRGEAGVGKTRLLDELVDLAEHTGFKVLRARADEFDKRVPLAALRLALDESLRNEDSPRYSADAQRLQSSLDFRREPQADAAGPQIFGLIHRVLVGWTDRFPTLLAIDDVHAADPDTLAALGYIGRHLHDRLLVAVTTRVRPPDLDVTTSAVLDRLADSGGTTQIELGPLDRAETSELVRSQVGHLVSEASVERIWSSTRGNPFFTVELARSLSERDMFDVAHHRPANLVDEAEMSMGRAATVLDRILRLGDDVESVTRTISVLPVFDLDDLTWVVETTGLSQSSVETAFDTLVSAGIVSTTQRRYEFAHPIVRETVYRNLGPTECRRLHRSVANFRLAQRDLGRAIDISDIARHLKLAGAADPAAAQAFIAAGDRTLAEAPRSSVGWYREALDATPPSSPRCGTTLARLARALLLASRHAEAAEVATAALASLPRGRQYHRTVRVLFAAYQSSGQFDQALDLVNQYADNPDVMTPRLIAQWAQVLLWHDRLPEARWVLESIAPARDAGTDSLVEGARLNMLYSFGFDREAHALAQELASSLDESSGLRRVGTLVALASAHAYNGYPLVASRWLAKLDDHLVMPETVGTARTVTAYSLGAWDRAIELAAELDERSDEFPHSLRPLALGTVALIHAERGDLDLAQPIAEALARSSTFGTYAKCAAGNVEFVAGRLERARELVGEAFERQFEIDRLGTIGRTALLLVEIELASGDDAAARGIIERVDAHTSSDRSCRDLVQLATARCLVGGDARECLDLAELANSAGLKFERACALLAGGQALGDADVLIEAATELRELGASAREREAVRALRGLGRRMPRSARSGDGLSDNEHRLAELVTNGLTNRQIAVALHLSPKTIEVYLTRLYAKVGCKSRVDLAVAMKTGAIIVASDTPRATPAESDQTGTALLRPADAVRSEADLAAQRVL